jgi:hypothetical protein
MSDKDVYVVLGMSRSGTSAIARALSVLDIDLGDKLLPGDSRNPKGFYEDAEVLYKINRGVSAVTGDLWVSIGMSEEQKKVNDVPLQRYKTHARELLLNRFSAVSRWGFKDPRTVNVLLFWQQVFAAMNIRDNYVLAMRNPLAAARSNQEFAQIDMETGLMIWLVTNIAAIEGTHHKKRVVISYESMLQDPRQQVARMHKILALPNKLDTSKADEYANEFLDKKLSHHEFSEEDLQKHAVLAFAPLCIKVYATLMKLARDELSFDSEEFNTTWHEIMLEFDKIFPVYKYISSQDQNIRKLQREIRTMRKSIPWRLLYPLRVIDDLLRSRRYRKREKKRLVNTYG